MPRSKKNTTMKSAHGPKQSSPESSPLESNMEMPTSHDLSQDSECLKLTSGSFEDKIEEEEDQDYDEKDHYGKVKSIYILRGGVLKRKDNWRMSKNDWNYRIIDTTGELMIVNYDLHDAVPFVKTILNEVAEFPEIIILERINKIVFGLMATSMILMVLGFRSLSSSHFDEKIVKIDEKIVNLQQEKKKNANVLNQNIPDLMRIQRGSGSTISDDNF